MIAEDIIYIHHTHDLSRTFAHLRALTHAHTHENSPYIYAYIYMHMYIATVFIYTPESCLKRAVIRLNRASIAP
jgi:hypothetical protein